MRYPAVTFRHLQRLTDHIGLLEHAEGIMPRYEHGYRVDDVARGLVVVCREPSPSQELITLGRQYLHFLTQAQAADGTFRDRLGYDRRWRDQPGTHDCWGKAIAVIGEPPADPAWPWPAPRLSYVNATLAEAVIVAGWKLSQGRVLRNGLRMLEWLLATETRDGHLSVVPAGGWAPGEIRPAFDQQPPGKGSWPVIGRPAPQPTGGIPGR